MSRKGNYGRGPVAGTVFKKSREVDEAAAERRKWQVLWQEIRRVAGLLITYGLEGLGKHVEFYSKEYKKDL